MGMAKLMFCAPKTMAALIPMATPSKFTKGPPELPWLIAASVWMSPLISWGGELGSAWAVIDRERPEMMPNETVFLKMPRALPIAITVWPSSSLFELASLMIGRLLASIFRMATSLMGSRVRI